METENAIYVHLKGPDEFGHDGDAIGKMKNIEEIDERFFGTLLKNIDTSKVAVMISADHATPCINKGHSDDPVPVLISGDGITNDGSERFTEEFAKKGGGHHTLHTHWNGHMSGFYFLKASEKTSMPLFEDPRPGNVMNLLPEKDRSKITYASSQVHYKAQPGRIMSVSYTHLTLPTKA